jgi:predicted phosphodiesterase
MRTLVISDIHGNLEALEAVLNAEPWDELVCLGDIVAYGPEPVACLALVRGAGGVVVQGNHDRALAEGIAPRCRPAFERLAEVTHELARAEASPMDMEYLATLPRW